MVKEDPADKNSECVPSVPALCKAPMIKKDLNDPKSECVKPTPPVTPIECEYPMVKQDLENPNSECIMPDPEICPPPAKKCNPPMEKQDPEDPLSICVEPVDPIEKPVVNPTCVAPMVKEDPNDPTSNCVEPTPVNPIICGPGMFKIDPKDPRSECVEPVPNPCVPPRVLENPANKNSRCELIDELTEPNPNPNPNVCYPPMVKEDPLDPKSKCVLPGPINPTPVTPPKKCTPPMTNLDPNDPFSKCVNPIPVNPTKCTPPMVITELKDGSSKCVNPTNKPITPTPVPCLSPMIRKVSGDENSACIKPNPIDPIDPVDPINPVVPYECGDIKINFRPFFREVNTTINVTENLCATNNTMSDKIEVRGFIKSGNSTLSEEILSGIEIKFLNLKTLNVFIPELHDNKYIIQLPRGRYKIMVSAPKFANFNYEANLQSSSCENNVENNITLLTPSKSGVEISLTAVIPVSIGDKVKICNSTDYNPGVMTPQKKRFINLRGEIINSMEANNHKLKLDTNNMNDDVVIYLHGIKDLLKNGHTKLHILTDDGNQHCIDIPQGETCNKTKVVIGHIDKDTKKFKKVIKTPVE